jgi:hypothetical protein
MIRDGSSALGKTWASHAQRLRSIAPYGRAVGNRLSDRDTFMLYSAACFGDLQLAVKSTRFFYGYSR